MLVFIELGFKPGPYWVTTQHYNGTDSKVSESAYVLVVIVNNDWQDIYLFPTTKSLIQIVVSHITKFGIIKQKLYLDTPEHAGHLSLWGPSDPELFILSSLNNYNIFR